MFGFACLSILFFCQALWARFVNADLLLLHTLLIDDTSHHIAHLTHCIKYHHQKQTNKKQNKATTTNPPNSHPSKTNHWQNSTMKETRLMIFNYRVALRPQKPFGLLATGSPGWPPRLSHSSWPLTGLVQFYSTSTETARTISDGKPRTATSTFTQLLTSDRPCSMLLYVHRDSPDYQRREARDGHLDFHTAPDLWQALFNVTLRPQRQPGLLATGSPGRPPRLSHSSWPLTLRPQRQPGLLGPGTATFSHSSCLTGLVQCYSTSTETARTTSDGKPGTATSTFTQLLTSD